MIVSVFTLGCKTNLYESGQIVSELQRRGHNAFHGLKKADVYVLNTCAVTGEAEKKSRQLVARARKLNPDCKIFVVGCAAEKNPAQFEGLANIVFVKGVAGKIRVADEIEKSAGGEPSPCAVDVEALPSVYTESNFACQERTRAFVKIQDGCNNFCSYCIVPYLRGRSRSRKIADVAEEVRLANSRETVLIGIDISQYGRDNGESLAGLFKALRGVKTRIRLGSLEARVVTDELLQSLAETNFCPHFHLSLQSGSNGVLKRMNRKYTAEEFFAATERIRRVFPCAALTTDVIVGFSGETDEEFEETCAFVQKVGFADIHVFPYSPREGTAAYSWQDVPSEVKTARAERLGQIKAEFKRKFALAHVRKTCEVLAERKVNGVWEGYTADYLRVFFKGETAVGELVNVKICRALTDGAEGEIV